MVMPHEKDNFAIERLSMVHQQLRDRGITDQNVLDAMGQIPREQFIPSMYRFQSYADGPVAIGMGQTISQPYIVALMTQILELNSDHEVLEIGTGSGYQTAILAKIAKKVYTIERLGHLSESAQVVLAKLEFNNIEFAIGDGSLGWPVKKKFDRIMVTAAAPSLPQPLTDQLTDGGVLVIPVGDNFSQELFVYRKLGDKMIQTPVADVRFVNLVGKFGFSGE